MTFDLGHEWGRLVMMEGEGADVLSPHLWCRKCGCSDQHADGDRPCPARTPTGKKLFATRWVAEQVPF